MSSGWNNPNFDSPTRWKVYQHFISKKGINCIGKEAYGITSSLKSVYPNLSKNEISKYSDRLTSQWAHRYEEAITKFQQDQIENKSSTTLDEVFNMTPTMDEKVKRVCFGLIQTYNEKELRCILDHLSNVLP